MTEYKRDNLTSKTNYYTIFIIVELLIIVSLFYFDIHWLLLIFIIPILLIDILSNKRCLNRQKNFIASIKFEDDKLICKHLKNNETVIPFDKAKFSIRERKFEKDKTEIEIKFKNSLKSKLIGRLHINNWSDIFKIRGEFIKNKITQVKYKPEGYWSKYGGYTADAIIITSSLTLGEIADFSGDTEIASDARELGFNTDFSSIHEDKDEKASR
jgi:hypothetical protein